MNSDTIPNVRYIGISDSRDYLQIVAISPILPVAWHLSGYVNYRLRQGAYANHELGIVLLHRISERLIVVQYSIPARL